jgi:hypothetical protein
VTAIKKLQSPDTTPGNILLVWLAVLEAVDKILPTLRLSEADKTVITDIMNRRWVQVTSRENAVAVAAFVMHPCESIDCCFRQNLLRRTVSIWPSRTIILQNKCSTQGSKEVHHHKLFGSSYGYQSEY